MAELVSLVDGVFDDCLDPWRLKPRFSIVDVVDIDVCPHEWVEGAHLVLLDELVVGRESVEARQICAVEDHSGNTQSKCGVHVQLDVRVGNLAVTCPHCTKLLAANEC